MIVAKTLRAIFQSDKSNICVRMSSSQFHNAKISILYEQSIHLWM